MGNALFRGDGTGWSRADAEMQALLTAQHPAYAAVPFAVRVAAGAIWVMGKTFIWRRDAGGWRMFELTNADVFGPDDPTGSRGSFWFTSLWAGGRDDVAVGGAIHELGTIPDAGSSIVTTVRDGRGEASARATWRRCGATAAAGCGSAPRRNTNPPLFHDVGTAFSIIFDRRLAAGTT